jgi:hypothetical protein
VLRECGELDRSRGGRCVEHRVARLLEREHAECAKAVVVLDERDTLDTRLKGLRGASPGSEPGAFESLD